MARVQLYVPAGVLVSRAIGFIGYYCDAYFLSKNVKDMCQFMIRYYVWRKRSNINALDVDFFLL